ncbi:putative ABC transporter permease [Gordonibacter massiliensis (ex Traore et al. 2017)]|uniref:Putative ABC transporter permease n=1 Tax=Gordonibacter massiliensis (ex Traore et al. 2017) TaxID=1841863 RepID=A0A842J8W7_9ACTN|nr:putative ABC transporter permease [Gordonibacter massiliensis (ex Traore et al. 2017)]MBC2888482.1 putative ABC transporter permease [Gordonibacter massiliensis (ex Traore et al. 2017)]
MRNHRDAQHDAQADEKLESEIEALTAKENEAASTLKRKIPLPLKVFAILCIVAGVAILPMIGFVIVVMVFAFREGEFAGDSTASTVLFFALLAILAVLTVMFVVFGIRLLRDKRRHAAQTAEALTGFMVAGILCDIMLFGLDGTVIFFAAFLVFLVVLTSYLDPSLSEERELQRKLRDMEVREDAEDGTLGRDETGRGYIALNFFNIFWIFVVCCVLGLVIESVYHVLVVDPGHYEDRAGMLYGPFSPIYGFGAVLMTMALNRFHDKNVILIFLVSAVIGGAFEYAVSWFMQYAFGIVAWDYTGTFLSIDGRTNGMFMAMWGILGVVWIKLCLPWMLKLVNLIPWNWRYALTTVAAVLMIADGVMTLVALDCWYGREAGKAPDSAIAEFCNEHYDNDFMKERFQSMSIDPDRATRAN